jgi:hypothetical protein
MSKEALEAAIGSLEAWGRTVDNWVLVFAAIVAIALTAEVVFSVLHWRNENSLRPLRTALATQNAREIAELNNETAQLRKQLEPRKIDLAGFVKLLDGAPKAPVEIVFVRDDAECFQLAMQIRDALKAAKWEVTEPTAIIRADEPRMSGYPSAMGAGGQPKGVTIVQRATSQQDFLRENMLQSMLNPDLADTPARALSRALSASLGGVAGGMSFDTGTVGVLRVVVGSKP